MPPHRHAYRDYAVLTVGVTGAARRQGGREGAMRLVADAIWDEFHGHGVSWVGFYVKAPARDELVLGPCRDKPACSPIGLHGACGRAWREGRALVVRDVSSLGSAYIACDPRDRSEVVVPLLEPSGACWGVLDLDSHEAGAFSEHDARGLRAALVQAGLTDPGAPEPPTLVI